MDSVSLFRALTELILGGANSPFRAFGQVGGPPLGSGPGQPGLGSGGSEHLDRVCGGGHC